MRLPLYIGLWRHGPPNADLPLIYRTGAVPSRHDSRFGAMAQGIQLRPIDPAIIRSMTGVHLHLLVNHAPIFGAFFALGLFIASYLWAPDVLRRTAFVFLIFTALAAGASDLTGEPAAHAVKGLPGIKREITDEHESMGEKSFIVASIVGVLAIGLLVKSRRAPVSNGAATTGFIASVIVSGMMAYTGLLGGRVRHTEVRSDATAADAAADAAAVEPPGTPPPR